jgi:hypothetical protein
VTSLVALDAPAAPIVPLPAFSASAPYAPLPSFALSDPVRGAFGFDRYTRPEIERPTHGMSFLEGRYGMRTWGLLPKLSLDGSATTDLSPPSLRAPLSMEEAAAPLREVDELRLSLDLLDLSAPRTSKRCDKRAVQFVRYGGEGDMFSLTSCDGSLVPDSLDRLSVIARPAGVDRPELPLPESPDAHAAESGEWVDHVRLLNPRLAWAVERVAEAFPHKVVYVISGYRPADHGGMHARGRAIDLFLMNVANERVYKFCRTLPDVGCGYYPNSKFVHIDVRKPGSGKAYWVDDSAPGTPSHYVDSWPGVEKGGAAVWQAGGER